MTRREHQPSRFYMWTCVAAALAALALMGAGAADADARVVELRAPDGGSSARIVFERYRKTNVMVFRGRIWDRRGDGMHARVYVDRSRPVGRPIAWATRGRFKDFGYGDPLLRRGAEHSFMVCTLDRDHPGYQYCDVTRVSIR